MSDPEKEAREIVRDVLDVFVMSGGSSMDFDAEPYVNRILRLARQYGPQIAHQEGMRALKEALPGVFSPVEDTTPAGWTREPRTTLAHSTQPLPP